MQTGCVDLTFPTFMYLWNQDIFLWLNFGQGMNEHSWSYTALQQQIKDTKTGAVYPQNESYYKSGEGKAQGGKEYGLILSIIWLQHVCIY